MDYIQKLAKMYGLVATVFILCLGVLKPDSVLAEDSYSEYGPVWMIWYARVDDEKLDDYLRFVSTVYRHKVAAWRKAGLLTDFKLLVAKPQSPDDWNVAFMYQYENMAAMDVTGEAWDKAAKEALKQFEADENVQKMLEEYETWRRFVGWSKPAREVIFETF